MVITSKVQSQFFENQQQLIRIAQDDSRSSVPTKRSGTPWTHDEHERFLRALEKYPSGPWKLIAWSVGTRTTRQTMTHAQKYREKIARRRRLDEQTKALSRCSSFMMTVTDDSGVDVCKHECAVAAESASLSVSLSHSTSLTAASSLPESASASGIDVNTAVSAARSGMSGEGTYTAYINDSDNDERVLDASIALLLESYEPLEISADDPFWEELRAFSDEVCEQE